MINVLVGIVDARCFGVFLSRIFSYWEEPKIPISLFFSYEKLSYRTAKLNLFFRKNTSKIKKYRIFHDVGAIKTVRTNGTLTCHYDKVLRIRMKEEKDLPVGQ